MIRRFAFGLTALLLATALVPAPAAGDAEDRNLRFLLDGFGLDAVPEGIATVYSNGIATQMPLADALEAAAARAGGVDLAALAASAGGGSGGTEYVVGDVWVLEFSNSSCLPPTPIAPVEGPGAAFHEQLYVYKGIAGHGRSPGGSGMVTDWTTKGMFSTAYTGYVEIDGVSDFFCINFFGFTLFFPYVDGIVTIHHEGSTA